MIVLYTRVNNQRVLTAKPLEDVVQSHSNQVKDPIEEVKFKRYCSKDRSESFSLGQWNLIKVFQNDASTALITKNAWKQMLDFFSKRRSVGSVVQVR